jgi:hypothetical protein
MHVCELEEMPRDGRKLQHAIHEWRHARKMNNLLKFASLNMAFWLLYVWVVWMPGQAAPAPALADAAPVVVIEQPTAPAQVPPAPSVYPAPGAELGSSDQAAAPGAELGSSDQAAAPGAELGSSDQAAPVVAVAVEEGAPAGDQAAAPAGPHRVYLALIVRGENDE